MMTEYIRLRHCSVDLARGRVRRDGVETESLTTREIQLLGYLVAHAGQTVSRDELLVAVWGYAPHVISRACDNGMARLRNKLESDPANPDHFLTVHGEGYRYLPLALDEAPVQAEPVSEQRLQLGGRLIDLQRRKITGTDEGQLTAAEAAVLSALADARGAIVEKGDLSRVAGGSASGRGLANLVARLRAKIEDDAGEPRFLMTVRGVGYRLETGDEAPAGAVTLLFTDIQGSTLLWHSIGDKMAAVLSMHDRLLTDAVREHAGFVVGMEGDGLIAAFKTPAQAASCALAAQEALHRAAWPVDFDDHPELSSVAGTQEGLRGLRVRMAIHTGRPLARKDVVTGRTTYAGPPVHLAGRLVRAGTGGQILVTAEALAGCGSMDLEMSNLGAHHITGVAEPVAIHQIDPAALAPRSFPPLRAAPIRHTNLPPTPSGFIGRALELTALETAWAEGARLVTLVGPAGVGKTQLARVHGAAVLPRYPGGVWWCDLAVASEAKDIVRQLARALALPEVQEDGAAQLGAALHARGGVLVVFDNAETVPEAVSGLVSEWLVMAPEARILVTSQARLLHLEAHTIRVQPLDEEDGVRLFMDRAMRAMPEVQSNPEAVVAMRRVVAALDGLPLAIGLAAARVGVLSVEQIADRLETVQALEPTVSHAGLLSDGATQGRHRSLRTALAWSWEHMSPEDQDLMGQLGVFAGTFDHQAIAAVVAAPDSAPPLLDRVQRLVDLSLVHPVPGSNPRRFRLLGAVRAFAVEQPGDRQGASLRHARHFAQMGSPPDLQALRRHGAGPRLARLMTSWTDLLTALQWAQSAGEPDLAADLCMAAAEVLDRVGPVKQAVDLLGDTAEAPEMSASQRVRLRLRSVRFHLNVGDWEGAERARQAAADLLAQRDAPGLWVWSEVLHATLLHWRGDRTGPLEILAAALPHAEALPDPFYGALVRFQMGLVLSLRNQVDADVHLHSALEVFRSSGARFYEAWCLATCATLTQSQLDVRSTRVLCIAALEAYRDSGYRRRLAVTETSLGTICRLMGQYDEAEAYFASAERIIEDCGDPRAAARVGLFSLMVPVERGDVTGSRRCVERLRVNLADGGELRDHARLAVAEGYVLELEGRPDEALSAYESGRKQSAKLGLAVLEALAFTSMGRIHLDRSDLDSAGVALSKAHEIATEQALRSAWLLNDPPRAEWLARTGQVAEAESIVSAAIEGMDTTQLCWHAALGRCHGGHVALAAGDASRARAWLVAAQTTASHLGLEPTADLSRAVERLSSALDG